MKAKQILVLIGCLAAAPAVAVAQSSGGKAGQSSGQAGQAGRASQVGEPGHNRMASQPEPAPSDAQIAMIAVVADNLDIEAGKLAEEKAQAKRVKDFAELMVRDHTSVNEKANALVKRLGIVPAESATSRSLKADGERSLTKLKGLRGAEFDKAYVDHEVAFHEAVIDLLDKTLLPNTQNAELKKLLESSRPVFVSHLEHAKGLQASLK